MRQLEKLYIYYMKNTIGFWKLYKIIGTLLLAMVTIVCFFLSRTYTINKTIGWAWDTSNYNFWFNFIVAITLFLVLNGLIVCIMKSVISVFKKSK